MDMEISQTRIAEFITSWDKAFDELLTPAEARLRAEQLMVLCRRLVMPLPKNVQHADRYS